MLDLALTRTACDHRSQTVARTAMIIHSQNRRVSIIRRIGGLWHVANPGQPIRTCANWWLALAEAGKARR